MGVDARSPLVGGMGCLVVPVSRWARACVMLVEFVLTGQFFPQGSLGLVVGLGSCFPSRGGLVVTLANPRVPGSIPGGEYRL